MTKREGEVHSSGVADVGIREGFKEEVAFELRLEGIGIQQENHGEENVGLEAVS